MFNTVNNINFLSNFTLDTVRQMKVSVLSKSGGVSDLNALD